MARKGYSEAQVLQAIESHTKTLKQGLERDRKQVQALGEMCRLLHFIVEHDSGEFEDLEQIRAEALQYGIGNVLELRLVADERRRQVRDLLQKTSAAAREIRSLKRKLRGA